MAERTGWLCLCAQAPNRISIWNRTECRKISGNAAPMDKNLAVRHVHSLSAPPLTDPSFRGMLDSRLPQDYLRKHPDCEVYNSQDESLDMKAIREQRKNPGLPNATYVNYLVDPESSQLYLQMNASSRRSRPNPAAADGYGNEQYGYQQVRVSCQRAIRDHSGARARERERERESDSHSAARTHPTADWPRGCWLVQDSNYQLQQQLGMAGGGAAGDGGASVEGCSPSMFMAGTPSDWVEPRGSSLERESAMGMVGSPAVGGAALPPAPAEVQQPAASQVAAAGGDDDMVQDMEL